MNGSTFDLPNTRPPAISERSYPRHPDQGPCLALVPNSNAVWLLNCCRCSYMEAANTEEVRVVAIRVCHSRQMIRTRAAA